MNSGNCVGLRSCNPPQRPNLAASHRSSQLCPSRIVRDVRRRHGIRGSACRSRRRYEVFPRRQRRAALCQVTPHGDQTGHAAAQPFSRDLRHSTGSSTTNKDIHVRKAVFAVNADATAGQARAILLDKVGEVIPDFGLNHCTLVASSVLRPGWEWSGSTALSALVGMDLSVSSEVQAGAKLFTFHTVCVPEPATRPLC